MFITVAMDCFTKWVEAKPMRVVEQLHVIDFIKENLVHRFGLPETITVDQSLVFIGERLMEYARKRGIKIHSTPYYAHDYGQAEASNKLIKSVIQKMVDENLHEWHGLLSMIL